jgi:hypothetical protein
MRRKHPDLDNYETAVEFHELPVTDTGWTLTFPGGSSGEVQVEAEYFVYLVEIIVNNIGKEITIHNDSQHEIEFAIREEF